jgi:hypothetical protein
MPRNKKRKAGRVPGRKPSRANQMPVPNKMNPKANRASGPSGPTNPDVSYRAQDFPEERFTGEGGADENRNAGSEGRK